MARCRRLGSLSDLACLFCPPGHPQSNPQSTLRLPLQCKAIQAKLAEEIHLLVTQFTLPMVDPGTIPQVCTNTTQISPIQSINQISIRMQTIWTKAAYARLHQFTCQYIRISKCPHHLLALLVNTRWPLLSHPLIRPHRCCQLVISQSRLNLAPNHQS